MRAAFGTGGIIGGCNVLTQFFENLVFRLPTMVPISTACARFAKQSCSLPCCHLRSRRKLMRWWVTAHFEAAETVIESMPVRELDRRSR